MTPEQLERVQSRSPGVGIRGMRERLRQFNGQMKIESGNWGTRVFVTVPIDKKSERRHSEMESVANSVSET